jgi:hypothetical protein
VFAMRAATASCLVTLTYCRLGLDTMIRMSEAVVAFVAWMLGIHSLSVNVDP